MVAEAPDLLVGGRIGIEELLAQSKRAEWQTQGLDQPATRESGDLQAPAAKIEEKALRDFQPSHGAGEPVSRFCQPSDNLDSNPELAFHALSEERGVTCIPHRSGGHRDDALRAHAGRDRAKIPKRFHRARHCCFAQLRALVDVVDQAQGGA